MQQTTAQKSLYRIAGGLVVLALAACASAPIPADKLTRSTSAIKSAETLDAARDPNAAAYLQNAKEEQAKGKQLLEDADNEKAGRVLSRAEADGIAARELARAKSSRIEVQKTQETLEREKQAIGGMQ